MEEPAFADLLSRLMDYRGLSPGSLSRLVRLSEGRPGAGLDNVAPDSLRLRALAPVLGMHAADLFLAAGLAVPDDLCPLDAKAMGRVDKLAEAALGLRASQRSRLLARARSLGQEERTAAPPEDLAHRQYQPGVGALLVGMLRVRNLDPFATVHILVPMTGRYVASSVISRIGLGKGVLTPEWLADFGAVLGMSAGLLAAVTGLEVADVPRDPAVVDAADLIWEARRLVVDQVRYLIEVAKLME